MSNMSTYKETNKLLGTLCLALIFIFTSCSQNKKNISDLKDQQDAMRATQPNGLKKLSLDNSDGQLSVKFEAEKALSPNIFRLSDPQRIVVDLVNTKNLMNSSLIESNNDLIKEITINEFNDADNILSRVVIILNQKTDYEAHAERNGMTLKMLTSATLNPLSPELKNALNIEDMDLAEQSYQANDDSVTTDPITSTTLKQNNPQYKNQLLKVLSKPQLEGTSIEMIFSEELKTYHDFSLHGPNRIVFDLDHVENVLTQGKQINVSSDEVKQIRIGESNDKSRAVVDLSSNAGVSNYKVTQTNNRLKIFIPAASKELNNSPVRLNTKIAQNEKQSDNDKAPIRIEPAEESSSRTLNSSSSSSNALSSNDILDIAQLHDHKTVLDDVKPLSLGSEKKSVQSSVPTVQSNEKNVNQQKARIESIHVEKTSEHQGLIKVLAQNNALQYDVIDSKPGLLTVQLTDVDYKKSSLKKDLKKQDFSKGPIKGITPKIIDKQTVNLDIAMDENAIFELTQDDKNLFVRVKEGEQNTLAVPSKPNHVAASKTYASTAAVATPKPVVQTPKSMPLVQQDMALTELESPANDLVEIQGLEDENKKQTFPQERVIENPLGLQVQKSSTPKNYTYVKEEFMNDTIAEGEPLSQMGSILSGAVQGRQFTGRKISLDFKDAEVKSIFKLIAEISQFNIIISDDVTGKITIRLDEVPWDQAFAIILQTRGLWFEKYGNIIRVAPAANLQKEKEAAADAEKAAKAVKPLDVLFKPVSFAQASTLEKQVKSMLSDRGTVDIDSRTNTLIIKDIREHLDKAKRMIDILDTQTPQVTIEARIVEATTTFTRSFGINWSGSASFTSATGNPTGLFFPNSVDIPSFALNFPVEAGTINTQANLKLGSINNILDLDLAIALGEQEGNFKLISSPKVTVLDNSSANISAGTRIPYQSQSDNNGTNVNFETATTNLSVTPHITNDGSILMNISATRDEPNFSASVNGNPSIDQRTASTEVLVKSGNTTVIGGIYSTSTGGNQSRFPVLHRIPIIGALFKNYNKTVRRSELLIFVTPRIVGDERKAIRNVRE